MKTQILLSIALSLNVTLSNTAFATHTSPLASSVTVKLDSVNGINSYVSLGVKKPPQFSHAPASTAPANTFASLGVKKPPQFSHAPASTAPANTFASLGVKKPPQFSYAPASTAPVNTFASLGVKKPPYEMHS